MTPHRARRHVLHAKGPASQARAAAGIACYSTTQCVAVGAIPVGTGSNQTTEAAYVVITNGQVGQPVVASKNLASVFSAVSCASPKECYAVGTYYNPSTQTTASIVGKV